MNTRLYTEIVSHTDYADGQPPLDMRTHCWSHQDARRAMAHILRDIRRNVDVCIIRDTSESYFITNVYGPMRFERALRIETIPAVQS